MHYIYTGVTFSKKYPKLLCFPIYLLTPPLSLCWEKLAGRCRGTSFSLMCVHTKSQCKDANRCKFVPGDANGANQVTLLQRMHDTPKLHSLRKLKNFNSSGEFSWRGVMQVSQQRHPVWHVQSYQKMEKSITQWFYSCKWHNKYPASNLER